MSNFNKKPNRLLEEFRAAGRLINEWRDTLTYAALFTLAATEVYATGQLHGDAFVFAGLRELVRAGSWGLGQDAQLIGSHSPGHNRTKMAAAAAATGFSIWVINTLCQYEARGMQARSFVVSQSAAALAFLIAAGGVREVFKAYTETMWDYPRKRDGGGGKTQTQRLSEALSGFSHGIANRLGGGLPQPTRKIVQKEAGIVVPAMS